MRASEEALWRAQPAWQVRQGAWPALPEEWQEAWDLVVAPELWLEAWEWVAEPGQWQAVQRDAWERVAEPERWQVPQARPAV